MPLKLFEFLEQFITGTFLMKLIQFEKNGSRRKIFILLGDLNFKFHFKNYNLFTFFVTFTLLLFDSALRLTKEEN